jgi:hypothetical protein
MAASCSILGAKRASCKHAEHAAGSQVHKPTTGHLPVPLE